MPNAIDFSSRLLAGGQRHPLLALVPAAPAPNRFGSRWRALHASADNGAAQTHCLTREIMDHHQRIPGQEIADQLPGLPARQLVQEPCARNTAPACALAAFLIERENPDAVLRVFPSDHVIADEPRFLKALQKGHYGCRSGR